MQLLPTNKNEITKRGWKELDILLVSADAYCDHPSFGIAILSRVLESKGYKVGIIAQPNWLSIKDFTVMGTPRLFVGISGGNLDWLVSHYTPVKKRRSADAYSPGGETGLRPNRPLIAYTNKVREAFGKIPIIIGGLEASLRRFAHYDYLEDKLRRSILLDSGAHILAYGMGETQIVEIANRLNQGDTIESLDTIRGTMITRRDVSLYNDAVFLPSYEDILSDKENLIHATKKIYSEQDPFHGKTLVQKTGQRYIIQLPPPMPLAAKDIDLIYDLPYTREAHPSYKAQGGIPALTPVQFSITSHRGCMGNCTFCSISAHQGTQVQSRSETSILKEVTAITHMKSFRGTISDVGGPTANMYMMHCIKMARSGKCKDKTCMGTEICNSLICDHSHQLKLLKKIRSHPKVKHVFLSTGVRYDLVLKDTKSNFFKELCAHYISGQLKIAPEHSVSRILRLMHKPPYKQFTDFISKYDVMNKTLKKKQYVVTYFISSFPGCTLDDMISLALETKKLHFNPEQIQDFTPTPMTLATAMYYAEKDLHGNTIHVAKTVRERKMQRALLQHSQKRNYMLVKRALKETGKEHLLPILLGKNRR